MKEFIVSGKAVMDISVRVVAQTEQEALDKAYNHEYDELIPEFATEFVWVQDHPTDVMEDDGRYE